MYDIDLFTGSLAEKPLKGAMVGPTLACLLARQFAILRQGDRFWYENDLPPSSFTADQLAEIRKTSLARILCNNGDETDFIQPDAMLSSDVFLNAFQYCNTKIIPQMDLNKWATRAMDTNVNVSLMMNTDFIKNEFVRAKREALSFFEHEHQTALARENDLSQSQLMHYRTTRAKRQSIAISNQSLVFEKATYGILKHLRQGRDREADNDIQKDINELVFSLSKLELSEYLQNHIFLQDQLPSESCGESLLPCDHTSPFRTITGWCNNLAHPHYGKSISLFERLLPPAYDDGISTPRIRSVVAGGTHELPSPRAISVNVHGDISRPHVRYVSSVFLT